MEIETREFKQGEKVRLVSVKKYTDNGVRPLIPLNAECYVIGYMDKEKQRILIEHDDWLGVFCEIDLISI